MMIRNTLFVLLIMGLAPAAHTADMQLLWGDTHVHSAFSFDAFLNGNRSATPETAYRFARGEPVIHPYHRARMQIDRPLDFIVVADHAEYLGVAPEVYYTGVQLGDDAGIIDRIRGWLTEWYLRRLIDKNQGAESFRSMLPEPVDPRVAAEELLSQNQQKPVINSDTLERRTWLRSIEAADAYYEPGRFTTFIGWEWSSTPGGANLHRVVISDADQQMAKRFRPFSAVDSSFPEDLWAWLAKTAEATGVDFLSIPHNSNVSKGYMFDDTSLRGEPFSEAYVQSRTRWERVAEITQMKGDSETHPVLSPGDEFAEFETYGWYMQGEDEPYQPRPGDYLRSALKRGLAIEERLGINPYRLGLIGSTDSHNTISTVSEIDFGGKHANESTPETKSGEGENGWSRSAAGLAAVWAEVNNREAIMAALKRREVYATTGPRIGLQMFGGWRFDKLELQSAGSAGRAREQGVPMGGVLERPANPQSAPRFVVFAVKDPEGANLDRIQIVKGWLNADGSVSEKVYDAAWSGERSPDSAGKLPAVGNTVDRETGRYDNSIGSAQLVARWQDPAFDPAQSAFYYARILQIPTPTHRLLDALALGLDQPPEGDPIIQERAYSSPIWYRPD